MQLRDLETPCLLLDETRMSANIRRMHTHLRRHGVTLRPHLKTSKCLQVAARLVVGQPGGICVSTLQEADVFEAHGLRDQLYTVAISSNKLEHLGRLLERGSQVMVLLDNAAAGTAIEEFGCGQRVRIPVLLEVDCDGHRSGLAPSSPELVPLALSVARSKSMVLKGVMTHAGGSYDCRGIDCIRAAAVAERKAVLDATEAIRAAGIACPIVSVGSTPTAVFGSDFSGITEVRAGVFVFNDLLMVNLGVCTFEDVALSVLTTVIGHCPDRGQLITDSGWMALSADLGTTSQVVDYRFGLVCDQSGTPARPELVVTGTNQEHGIIGSRSGALDLAQYPVGTLLRILPVHACATAAAHDRYYITRGSEEIVDVWERIPRRTDPSSWAGGRAVASGAVPS